MKVVEMGSSYSRHGGEEDCIWHFGEKARKTETTRKPRHRREDNIKMDPKET
jgi:hypothetical protein